MAPLPKISILQTALYQTLGNWLLGILGSTATVVQGQQNRISMPTGDFVVMTTIGPRKVLHKGARNVAWAAGTSNPGTETLTISSEGIMQLDFYGPNAADYAALVNDLISTEYNFDYFQTNTENGGVDMQPLFSDGVRNLTIINGEGQYEPRWSFDLHFQYNPNVVVPLDFMTNVDAVGVSVESQFPLE